MNQDQVIETSNQETQVVDQVQDNVQPDNKEQQNEQQVFKAFNTEDEYNKAIQSERSKAKYEILQELGIKNVDEFKTLKKSYDDSIESNTKLTSKVKELETNIVLNKLGVDESKYTDFLTLANNRITDGKTLEDVAESIKADYPALFKMSTAETQERINIGTDRSENKKQDTYVSQDLLNRFPWLAK